LGEVTAMLTFTSESVLAPSRGKSGFETAIKIAYILMFNYLLYIIRRNDRMFRTCGTSAYDHPPDADRFRVPPPPQAKHVAWIATRQRSLFFQRLTGARNRFESSLKLRHHLRGPFVSWIEPSSSPVRRWIADAGRRYAGPNDTGHMSSTVRFQGGWGGAFHRVHLRPSLPGRS